MPRRHKTGLGATRKTAAPAEPGLVVNGWTLLFTEQLLNQIARLTRAAETEQRGQARKIGRGRRRGTAPTSNSKIVAALYDLLFDEIPQDPNRRDFRQGATLGENRSHWFRAKFGGGRFRLFFRYRSDARIIVYAWVNDSDTLRTYGKTTDAYNVFARMLDAGTPPDSWDALRLAARRSSTPERSATLTRRDPRQPHG